MSQFAPLKDFRLSAKPFGASEERYTKREDEMRKFAILTLAGVSLAAFTGDAPAAGDAAKGKAAFGKCGICHQIGEGAKTIVGPELNGIVGRKAAAVADYAAMYSAGMKKLGAEGFVWTEENLDKWIATPKDMIADSPMALAFPGIPDAAERADIIAYLKNPK
jgi:cytochrome c